MINMSMLFTSSVFALFELKSSNSPMSVLVMLLFIMWFGSLLMLFSGKSVWGLIYLIMLFMGGLMITYLFIISMMPKEKKVFLKIPVVKMLAVVLIFSSYWSNYDFLMLDLLNLSFWLLVFCMITISLVVLMIFILMMDPFKSMKSSF